jgi:hypothetical protein
MIPEIGNKGSGRWVREIGKVGAGVHGWGHRGSWMGLQGFMDSGLRGLFWYGSCRKSEIVARDFSS